MLRLGKSLGGGWARSWTWGGVSGVGPLATDEGAQGGPSAPHRNIVCTLTMVLPSAM